MNNVIKDYLSFSRKESIAFLVLVVLLVTVNLLPFVCKPRERSVSAEERAAFSRLAKQLKLTDDSTGGQNARTENTSIPNSYLAGGHYASGATEKYHASSGISDEGVQSSNRLKKYELRYFDPNTASADDWIAFGLRPPTVTTILKYISRGGYFASAADLRKIFGLSAGEFERLSPWVRIAKVTDRNPRETSRFVSAGATLPPNNGLNNPVTRDPNGKKREFRIETVDVNSSDTMAWIALPGIGSKLANRIIGFREKLGGFHSVEQVAETFGLHDSTFRLILPYLKLGVAVVKKININTADKETLQSHPYIRWRAADAILRFRSQHGRFTNLEQLQQIGVITVESYQRMLPYLELDDASL